MASRAPIPGMRSAIPRWPTPMPTCEAIHGIRAAKLPVTHPCTANTTAVERRASRTSEAPTATPRLDVAVTVTTRDYPGVALYRDLAVGCRAAVAFDRRAGGSG